MRKLQSYCQEAFTNNDQPPCDGNLWHCHIQHKTRFLSLIKNKQTSSWVWIKGSPVSGHSAPVPTMKGPGVPVLGVGVRVSWSTRRLRPRQSEAQQGASPPLTSPRQPAYTLMHTRAAPLWPGKWRNEGSDKPIMNQRLQAGASNCLVEMNNDYLPALSHCYDIATYSSAHLF